MKVSYDVNSIKTSNTIFMSINDKSISLTTAHLLLCVQINAFYYIVNSWWWFNIAVNRRLLMQLARIKYSNDHVLWHCTFWSKEILATCFVVHYIDIIFRKQNILSTQRDSSKIKKFSWKAYMTEVLVVILFCWTESCTIPIRHLQTVMRNINFLP